MAGSVVLFFQDLELGLFKGMEVGSDKVFRFGGWRNLIEGD